MLAAGAEGLGGAYAGVLMVCGERGRLGQFLLGNTRMGILLLVLTLGLQILRRVLEPKLMSDSMRITPLQSLIGMFVGMRYGGILGLIGGPVLMSVLVGAFKGGLFASTVRDCHVVSAWLRNRLK